MTDADTNLSNLTTLWLLLGAVLVFLMQVRGDFLFIIIIRFFFFRTNCVVSREILKKVLKKAIEASFCNCFSVFRKI